MSRYQTPLSRAQHLGTAREGTKHFWHQRLTALANIPLIVAFVCSMLRFVGSTYEQARQMMMEPLNSGLFALLILSVTWHMKLGMQVIVEDYVHSEGRKFFLLIMNNFFCALVAFASLFMLLRLSVGL